MIKKLALALIGVLGIVGIGSTQEIPKCLKDYIVQLQKDSNINYGFNYSKERKYISKDDNFQDWFVGLPFQFYDLNVSKLDTANESTKFKDLIEPTNDWCIPIKIKNNYIYHILVEIDKDNIKPFGCGEDVIGFKTWDKVRKEFPEVSGISPVYIDYPYQLLFFPNNKKEKNIFHARNLRWNDPMSNATSKDLNKLDDAQTIIPLLKDKIKAYKEQEKEMERLKKEFQNKRKDSSGGN